MARPSLTYYKLQAIPEAEKCFRISKFNADLNVESSYVMNFIPTPDGGYYDCNCPAAKFDCRHKLIMKAIRDRGKIDSSEFYCFETKTFHAAETL